MPQIPIVRAKENLTGQAPAVPQSFRGIGEGLDALGEGFQNLGHALMRRQQILKKQDDVNTINEAMLEAETAYQKEVLDYTNNALGKDAYDGQSRLTDFSHNLREKIFEGKQYSPQVAKELDLRLKKEHLQYSDNFANHEMQQRQVVSKSNRTSTLDILVENSFRAVGKLDDNLEKYDDMINGQIQSHILSEEVGNIDKTEGKRKIAEATLSGIINRTPETAGEQLATGLWDKYLDKDSILHYTQVAKVEKHNKDLIEKSKSAAELKAAQGELGNKMTDAMLNGDMAAYQTALGQSRGIIDSNEYESRAQKYQTWVDNTNKKLDKDKREDNSGTLLMEVLRGFETEKDIADFKERVLSHIAVKNIESEDGKKLLADVNNFSTISKQKKEQMDLIEKMFSGLTQKKNRIIGKDKGEKELNKTKLIQSMRDFALDNPDKDMLKDFAEPMMKALIDNGKRWVIMGENPSKIIENKAAELTLNELEYNAKLQSVREKLGLK